MAKKPIVALVGRPNVGKSTLFNRILRKREAIVDGMPGVTRDRHYAEAEWIGRTFIITDTGGIIPSAQGGMDLSVREQAEIAVKEAHVIIFVVDVDVGVVEEDLMIGRQLKRVDKQVLLCVNKTDGEKKEMGGYGFYQLGFDDLFFTSAEHGRGVADMLDRLTELLPPCTEREDDFRTRIAVVGRPNVGKSSLVNRLCGSEKMIVHDAPGTTRDSIDTVVTHYGKEYTLIDTAGLRKRTRVKEQVEYYSNLRTQKAIKQCNVSILMIDAESGILSQDVRIARMTADQRVGAMIAVNKWDLVKKDTHTAKKFVESINEKMPFLTYAPVLFISALTGQRISKIYDQVDGVKEQLNRRISTGEFNKFLEPTIKKNYPPASHGKHIKIFYGAQRGVNPPTFVFFSNYPEYLPKNYLRYLENQIRSQFGFSGAPFRMHFNKRRTD
ncbi:MAG: ribosome biogenesis GTPase Der [Candidatus Cloacimonetes bacterium 4572_55]|nr:MAG: ribosome biogenesis GTPase Der [Candidatus Cloacimonetes bacterium 4572_55]